MARKETVEEQIEKLSRERVKIAGERAELQEELTAATAVLEGHRDRLHGALVDQARGRGDAVQDVEAEAARARVVVADRTARVNALKTAEGEIGEGVKAVESSDEGLAFLRSLAGAKSRAAEEDVADATTAVAKADASWMQALSGWTRYRTACADRGIEGGTEVPNSPLQAPISSTVGLCAPWPGGRRPENPPKTSLTVDEARDQLLEAI